MKLNFKNKRFLQYQIEFYQEKKISYSTRELYSFIFTHCHYHDNGWCGFSNERLAKELDCTRKLIEKNLKELKDKDMIIIENPGKRTKLLGESRQIHINARNYIVEEIPEDGNDELLKVIERQSKELEELKRENNRLQLERIREIYIAEIGHALIRIGFISIEQYEQQAEELNHILFDFEKWHGQGRDLTKACFSYWNTHKDSYIKNPVRYIITCITESKRWFKKMEVTSEGFEEKLNADAERWYAKDEE